MNRFRFSVLCSLALLMLLALSALSGPASPGLSGWHALWSDTPQAASLRQLMLHIRLPRFLLGGLVGAGLGASGAVLQGLFRNRLADPGIIGVSAGASLAVVAVLALASAGFLLLHPVLLIGAGFLGALLASLGAYALGRASVNTLLLAGIGINALGMAGTGLLIALVDDQTLRTFTFWSMGSLAGAQWSSLLLALPFFLLPLLLLSRLGEALNLMALGERPALFAGLDVEKLRLRAFSLTALVVAAGISLGGNIGFIGLVVPNALRMLGGEDQRQLLQRSAWLGAVLLIGADLLARTILAPREMPIGVITALLGAPVFLYLLRQAQPKFRLA